VQSGRVAIYASQDMRDLAADRAVLGAVEHNSVAGLIVAVVKPDLAVLFVGANPVQPPQLDL
jgi:hypothetical protein